ncbi:MAG: M48 family metalloprotease, partial [Candidatus Omnitrophota bacterium]
LNYSKNWWIITSLFWIFFSLILAKLTPTLIIPLFFKYTPLSDTELKSRIINLASKMQINILDVSQIDFSKKTLKANAAFVGMGKQKRVILADTLRDNYSYDEIEAILAHEFAHYKLKHLLKLILISSFLTIVMFYSLSTSFLQHLLKINSISDITYLPIILLFVILFDTIFTPFKNFLSRKLEENADRLALRFTLKPDAFVSMMEKLANQNLADRKPAWFIKIFFFDHPAIEDRINLAKKFKRRHNLRNRMNVSCMSEFTPLSKLNIVEIANLRGRVIDKILSLNYNA